MDPLDEYLGEVTKRVTAALGENIAGLYLHGSAAMGAFVPTRSDIDILAVTRGPVSAEAKVSLAAALSEAVLPCPGVGLELSIVSIDSAPSRSDTPKFELHLATLEDRVVDGAGHEGDPDLLAHFAMTRARGITLLGQPPEEVLAPVDRAMLLRSLADDLNWALNRGQSGYAVLNACRALRLSREGVVCSKPEGGRWALDEGIGEAPVILAALRRQRGTDEVVDGNAAALFATQVREELLREAATPSQGA